MVAPAIISHADAKRILADSQKPAQTACEAIFGMFPSAGAIDDQANEIQDIPGLQVPDAGRQRRAGAERAGPGADHTGSRARCGPRYTGTVPRYTGPSASPGTSARPGPCASPGPRASPGPGANSASLPGTSSGRRTLR